MRSRAAVLLAFRMAWRSEPAPESLVLVTVKTASSWRSSSDSRFNLAAVRRVRRRAAREAGRHDFSQERGDKLVTGGLLYNRVTQTQYGHARRAVARRVSAVRDRLIGSFLR